MIRVLRFVFFLYFHISFRFFFWLLSIEIIMVKILFLSIFNESSRVYICSLLVIGACEVGMALSIIVSSSRFSGLEKTNNLKCERF